MIDPNTTLFVTIGLPRSGKSTWAKTMGVPIVNPDSIRLAMHGQAFYGDAEPLVWAHAQLMVRSLFNAGHESVIVDATNTTERRRAMWRMMHPNITWVVFIASFEVCHQRAVDGGNPDLPDVVARMHKAMEPLEMNDSIIFINEVGIRMADGQPGWRKSPHYEGTTL